MSVALEVGSAVLLLVGSAAILWWNWRNDRPEDPGRVSEGYMRERGWWRE